jgi:glycosyltransferase involved in cell wall biosynthesis
MPAFNCAAYLDESIRSVLGQTFKEFEFVVVDDASTDDSADILLGWAKRDRRVRVVLLREHLGPVGSSNLAVELARAPLVARMDADDVSHPERLGRQVEALRDGRVVLVGTLCEGIDSSGRRVRPRDRWRALRRSAFAPFPHGSVMFRRAVFDEVGGYRAARGREEDADLYLRILKRGRLVLIPEALYRYRYHTESTMVALAEAAGGAAQAQEAAAEALYTLGAMRLWAGQRPETLRPLLRRGLFRLDRKGLQAFFVAAWGGVHPRSLRWLLYWLVRWRDLLAGRYIKDGRLYEWRAE